MFMISVARLRNVVVVDEANGSGQLLKIEVRRGNAIVVRSVSTTVASTQCLGATRARRTAVARSQVVAITSIGIASRPSVFARGAIGLGTTRFVAPRLLAMGAVRRDI
jgi:hypothetical protein